MNRETDLKKIMKTEMIIVALGMMITEMFAQLVILSTVPNVSRNPNIIQIESVLCFRCRRHRTWSDVCCRWSSGASIR